MKIDITELIIFVLTVLFAIITRYLVPWLQEQKALAEKKLGESTMEEIEYWTSVAVEAAEQRYKNKVGKFGQEKKLEVLKFLEDKGYIVDEDKIDALIESLVYNMKNEEIANEV